MFASMARAEVVAHGLSGRSEVVHEPRYKLGKFLFEGRQAFARAFFRNALFAEPAT